jgi:hypothetical protein
LIASGKRNFAIDMSPLDYIYSDTINMLMALNRKVLDVTGRLSLMSPQPEVMQILKRAGIHNILRIFETETELIKSSEDIILQTSSIKISDVNNALKQPPPQSEFDQLRSEIGSVFGSNSDEVESGISHESQSRQTQERLVGHEDEFNQMFQQFEPHGQKTGFGAPPIQPQISQPQSPKFQPRQYSQPSSPQSVPYRPASPVPPRQPLETPKFTTDYSNIRSETQRFSSAPAASFEEHRPAEISTPQKPVQLDREEIFDTSSKSNMFKKSRLREDFDSFDDDELHDEFKKKSALPALIIVLLVIILGGIGATIVYFTLQNKKTTPVATTTPSMPVTQPVQQPPTTPQIPVDTQVVPPPPASVSELETAKVPPKEIVESKPEIAPPPVRRSIQRNVRKSAYVPQRSAQTSVQPETKNQIVFSSSPSGASISINGQTVGTTPFTWTKPFFGTVNIQITKPGYTVAKKSFEFTGGSMNEFFSLEREVVETPPPVEKSVSRSVVKEPIEPVATPTVKKTPPPPPAGSDDEDLFEDIGEEKESDDFSLEPESETTIEKQPSTTASRPTTTSSSSSFATTPSRSSSMTSSSMGGEAQIFIASIPPVADVYIGDKLVGKTNVSELKLPSGPQSLRFVKGGKEITKEIILKPGKNPSQMVRIP